MISDDELIAIIDYFTKNGRSEKDCYNCIHYKFQDDISACKKGYAILDWDNGFSILNEEKDIGEDENFGSFRVYNGKPIKCQQFKKYIRGDSTKGLKNKTWLFSKKSKNKKEKNSGELGS